MNVEVKLRRQFIAVHNPVDTCKPLRHFLNGPRHSEQNGCTECLYLWCIPNELNDVAKALLDVQQDRLATELLATPYRASEVRALRYLRIIQPPGLVVPP